MKKSIIGLFARKLGLETLKGLMNDPDFEVKLVVTHYFETNMVDERELFKNFADLCENNNIPLMVVNKNQENLRILENIDFDFLVANCYKYIIPDEYLEYAKIASLNMHRSLLPKYKGLKPLKRALENKEKETGTTVHKMVKEVDSGEIVFQSCIPIVEGDTEQTLFEKLYPTQYPTLKNALFKLVK